MKVRLPNGEVVEVGNDALFNDDDTPFGVSNPNPEARFTAEDIERARTQEKDKLYGRIEDLSNTIKGFEEQVGGLTAAEQRRQAEAEQERARLEEEARKQEESELDARSLLERKQQEWNDQLNGLEQTWEQRFAQIEQEKQQAEAIAQREREYAELGDYTRQQVSAHQDKIAPELLGWITGNSKEEIDAAIARAVDTTNQIVESMQSTLVQPQVDPNTGLPLAVAPEQQPVAAPLPGVRPTAGPAGSDPASQYQTLTAEQIANMPMNKWAEIRKQIGIQGQSNNRGLFG